MSSYVGETEDASYPSRSKSSSLELIPGSKGKERKPKPMRISECSRDSHAELERV
jgi:hypothetical protein